MWSLCHCVQQVFLEVCAVFRHGLRMQLVIGPWFLVVETILAIDWRWPQILALLVFLGNPVNGLSCICSSRAQLREPQCQGKPLQNH